MGNSKESSHVSAVVALIGPIDIFQMDSQVLQLGYKPFHDVPTSGESILIGGQLTEFPERCQAINPTTRNTNLKGGPITGVRSTPF